MRIQLRIVLVEENPEISALVALGADSKGSVMFRTLANRDLRRGLNKKASQIPPKAFERARSGVEAGDATSRDPGV